MTTIEIVPKVGAGSVLLGMSRDAVHAAMGLPSASFKKGASSLHPTDAWLKKRFQVFYCGAEPVVEFIELSGGPDFDVICAGRSVFATPASELVRHLSEVAPFDSNAPELGYSYVFPALELAVWRPVLVEPEGRYFATIGIGTAGYFSR